MCFSDWSFAAEEWSEIWTITWTIDMITCVLDRLWLVFANLAWKFLTNNWVYGQALWIDILLWKYRNIVKNMANFCLWFYLMYVIFRWLIWQYKGKEDIVKNLKSVLLRVLIGWVWVQASRFLTSVVVDLSTITLSAVGAFPSQVLSENGLLKEWIATGLREFTDGNPDNTAVKNAIKELFPKDGAGNSFTRVTHIPLDKPVDEEKLLDSLLPNKDDISGPLYYMWFSILETHKVPSVDSASNAWIKKTLLNLIIQWWTTIIYSIEMAVLCIIALMRVLYLWMFIVLSPFAILFACIQKAWEKDLLKKWFIADLMKQINLKTFLAKVFQPVIIVFWISLCMIFVTLMSRVVNEDKTKSLEDFEVWWAKIKTLPEEKYNTSDDMTYRTRLDSDLLSLSISTAWKWLLDLMMAIITVVLVYVIIDMSIKIGNDMWGGQDFLSKKIETVQKWVKWLMNAVPVMPVTSYDENGNPKTSYISAGSAKWLLWKKIDQYQWMVDDKYTEQTNIIRSWINWEGNIKALKHEDKRRIEAMVLPGMTWLTRLTTLFDWIVEAGNRSEDKWWLKSGRRYDMTLNPDSGDGWWKTQFEWWLKYMNGKEWDITWDNATVWQNMVKWWNANESDRTLEKMFKENRSWQTASVKAYAKLFKLWDDIDTWDKLKNADISKKS